MQDSYTYPKPPNLVCGTITTRDYKFTDINPKFGMPLTGTLGATGAVKAGGNTGDGTLTAVSAYATENMMAGVWQLRVTALTLDGKFTLTASNGQCIDNQITLDGVLNYNKNGLKFTLTAGAEPFIIGDGFDITVTSTITPKYREAGEPLIGIYNGLDETITTAVIRSVITSGLLFEKAIVNSSGVALSLTDLDVEQYRKAGFYLMRNT